MNNKILIVTSEFPPLPGGIGNHAYLLAKYLQNSGYKLIVLSNYRSVEQDKEFDVQQNFVISRVNRSKLVYIERIRKALVKARQSDVIIVSGKFSLWLGGMLKMFFKRKKIIAVLHGSELKAGGFWQQCLTRSSLKKFDSLIAVSSYTKHQVYQVNGGLKVTIVNNGIEIRDELLRCKPRANTFSLVTVGNVTYRKGQQNVINALTMVKEKFPDVQYHCVGLTTEKETFIKLAETRSVRDLVKFHGALSDVEKENVLRNSSIFIMLSDRIKNDFEGFGIAILEANLIGLPSIGSRDSGIADAIKDGYSGKLVDPHNQEEIRNAVMEIMNNYALYSRQAKEWAQSFDWNNIVKKYISVIEQ